MRSEYSANQALADSAKQAKSDLYLNGGYRKPDRYMEALDMERKAKIKAQSAKLMKEVEAESAESWQAVINVIMQGLGLVAIGTFLYLIFISFWGN